MRDHRRVIIVGGGVAGLVLARELALGARDVTVLEASDHLGGTVARQTVGGIELDAGAESFATRGGTVATLAGALRLRDDIVEPNPEGAWLQPATGPAFRLPANSLLGIPGSPLASDVVAIIGRRAAWRAFSETLIPGSYASKAETVGELVRKRMGSAVLDQLVRPIIRGVHSADADELKVEQVAPGLRSSMVLLGSLGRAVLDRRHQAERAGSAVAGIRGGIVRLVDELAADLQRFGVRVELGGRVSDFAEDHVIVGGSTDVGRRIDGQVVIAAPGLLTPKSGPGHRIVLATLVVDQPLLDAAPRGTGVLVAEGASGIRARALTHSTAKWEWLADRAEGKHVIRLSYDWQRDSDEPADVATVAREDAAAILGVPLDASQVVDFGRVAWYRPSWETHTPNGIHAIGESIAGTGLASVIANATAMAGSLLTDGEGEPGLR